MAMTAARCLAGCDCRDAFPGLAKACAKPGVGFRDNLGRCLRVAGASLVHDLPRLVRLRADA